MVLQTMIVQQGLQSYLVSAQFYQLASTIVYYNAAIVAFRQAENVPGFHFRNLVTLPTCHRGENLVFNHRPYFKTHSKQPIDYETRGAEVLLC